MNSSWYTRAGGGRFYDLYFLIALLFAVGAFTNQLAGIRPGAARDLAEGAPAAEAVNTTIFVIAVYIFLRSPIWREILGRCWPIFLLPAMAIASALWANDPLLTLRHSMALLGSAIFGLSLATTYDFKASLRLLIRALFIVMFLSVFWAVMFPEVAIHQPANPIEAAQAGKWHGIFVHKNQLGAVAGITLALSVLYGRVAFRSIIFQLAALAFSGVCLVNAASGTGYVLAGMMILCGLMMFAVSKVSTEYRVIAFAFLFLGLGVISLFSDELKSAALALLGKDPDLTGRTVYWSYLLPFIQDRLVLGYGYFSGFLEVGATIKSITRVNFGSAHNGYLDVLLSFGLLGLIVAGLFIFWIFINSLRLIVSDTELGISETFPFCVVVYTLQHNLVESAILGGNCLYTLMPVLAAVMMARREVLQRLTSQYVVAPRVRKRLSRVRVRG